jgi:hypothetical protein
MNRCPCCRHDFSRPYHLDRHVENSSCTRLIREALERRFAEGQPAAPAGDDRAPKRPRCDDVSNDSNLDSNYDFDYDDSDYVPIDNVNSFADLPHEDEERQASDDDAGSESSVESNDDDDNDNDNASTPVDPSLNAASTSAESNFDKDLSLALAELLLSRKV